MKIFIDTETTGLDPIKNQILTIGIVIVDSNLNISYQEEIKIKQQDWAIINQKAMEINKIDLLLHNKSAIGELDACTSIIEILKKYDLINSQLYGHNVSFDITFLKKMFERNIVNYPFDYHFNDTMVLAISLKDAGLITIDSFSLSKMCAGYGINFNFHNALDDALASVELYKKFMGILKHATNK